MKTNEFIQTVNATINIFKLLPEIQEILPQIDELRKLHVRFQQKLDYLLVSPFSYEDEKEKQIINSTAQEIKDLANEHNILVSFSKLPKEYSEFISQFKETKCYVTYWYKQIQITGLIVYIDWKTKKKSLNKRVEQIKEFQFEDIKENHKVLDENGNDINSFPGLD